MHAGTSSLILLALLTAATPARAQGFLDEFTYDGLRFAGLGADFGGIWSDRLAGTVSMSANKVLKVTVPEFPRGATSAKVYVGTSPSALKLEATITDSRGSWTEDAAGLAGTGASPVTTSTFQENLLCRFGQEVFTPEHTAADLATCELLLQEVSES